VTPLQYEQSCAAVLDRIQKSRAEGDTPAASRQDYVLELGSDKKNEPIFPSGFVPALLSTQPKDNELKSIQSFKGYDKIRVFRNLLLSIPSGLHQLLYNAVDRYLVNDRVSVPRERLMQFNASLYYGLDVHIDKFLSDEWEIRHIHATNRKQWYKLLAKHD
jgi:hypothetical protein